MSMPLLLLLPFYLPLPMSLPSSIPMSSPFPLCFCHFLYLGPWSFTFVFLPAILSIIVFSLLLPLPWLFFFFLGHRLCPNINLSHSQDKIRDFRSCIRPSFSQSSVFCSLPSLSCLRSVFSFIF